MSKETTTKFKVDISELRAGITEANRQIKLANAEFKAAASGMDDWQKSTEGVSAKIKQLETVLDGENKKLANLKKQLELVEQEQGENSAGAEELQIKIANQQAEVNKAAKSLSKYKSKLEELEKQSDEAADASEDLADSFEDTKKAANDVEDAVKTMGDGFTVVKGTIANFIADGISNIISSIGNAVEESREYRKEMALLDTSFQTSNLSAEDAKNTYTDLYGILGDSGAATEAAQQLAKISKNEQDLEKNTRILAGVMGEYGASIPTEGLAEGMAATAAMGEVQGVLADALEWQGINLEEYNKKLATMSTAEERAAYIQETLLGLYGDSADAYLENNAAVIEANKTQAQYNETIAQLGAKAEPVVTSVKQGFADLLTAALDLFSGADVDGFANKISEGFGWIKDNVLPPVKDAVQWVIDNKDLVIAGIAGIGTAMLTMNVANMIMGVVKAFQAFKAANEGATVAQWLLNAAMSANPIGLIVALIAGLIAAFVTLWMNCEPFREFWLGLWDGIKNACSVAIDAIVNFFTVTIPEAFNSVINWIKENWDTLLVFLINPFAGLFKYFYENNTKFKEFVDNAINFIKELPGKIWEWLLATISKVAEWHKNMTNKAKEAALGFINKVIEVVSSLPGKIWTWFTDVVNKVVTWGVNLQAKGKQAAMDLFNSIVEKLKALPTRIVTIGSDIVKGLWNGIKDMGKWIAEKLKGFGDSVLGSIKSFFGIKSPSRVMRDQVGKPIVQGVAEGIKKNAKIAVDAIVEVGEMQLDSEKLYLEEKRRIEEEAAEKEYQERLANAKDAAEVEKIKQEKIKKEQEKAQEAYLENLKEAAESERFWMERRLEYVKTMFKEFEAAVDAIVAKQEKYADRLMSETEATFSKISFTFADGTTDEFYKLPDMSKTAKQLSEFSALLDEVFAKRGDLPEEVKEILANMDLEEGTGYLRAMLDASDAEWQQYIESFAEREAITTRIGEKLFDVDLTEAWATAWKNLPDEVKESWEDIKSVFSDTETFFGDTFTQAADAIKPAIVEMAGFMCDTVNEMLEELQSMRVNGVSPFGSLDWRLEVPSSDAPEMENGGVFRKGQRVFLEGKGAEAVVPLENNVRWIRATARDLKLQMKAEGLVGGTAGQAVTNNNYSFTQNNTSPKALSRLDIYRQTHNLLNFARG